MKEHHANSYSLDSRHQLYGVDHAPHGDTTVHGYRDEHGVIHITSVSNPLDTPPGGDAPDTPWWLRFLRGINYCDIDRYPGFAPPGDAVAWLWERFTAGTDCPCCLGTRLLIALAAAFAGGALLF